MYLSILELFNKKIRCLTTNSLSSDKCLFAFTTIVEHISDRGESSLGLRLDSTGPGYQIVNAMLFGDVLLLLHPKG